MTDHDDVQHRSYHQPDPDRVELRDVDDNEEGVFSVRMPIATTGEVRNQGDDPLSRDEIDGMRQQIDERAIGVFLDHGRNPDIAGSRYSSTEKVGEWEAPELQEREADGETELVATARMMDPETLPAATGALREALASIKEQVKRDFSLSSSIGWRDDDAYPGGVDLMETSIVGIGADPRTTSEASPAAVMARAAMGARGDDVDPEALVADFRAVVMGSDGPDEQRHLSDQQAEMARQMVDAYRDAQGDGSVENFEAWLFNVAWYEFDDDQFHAARTSLSEWFRETSPLDEPVSERFIPFLDERDGSGESTNEMTDESDQSGDDPDDTNREEDGVDAEEYRETMLEMQRQQTETLSALAEVLREDGDDDEEDDDDEDDDDDEEEDEQSADPDDEQAAEEVAELREALDTLRDGGVDVADVQLPEADDQDTETNRDADQGDANDSEDAAKALLRR